MGWDVRRVCLALDRGGTTRSKGHQFRITWAHSSALECEFTVAPLAFCNTSYFFCLYDPIQSNWAIAPPRRPLERGDTAVNCKLWPFNPMNAWLVAAKNVINDPFQLTLLTPSYLLWALEAVFSPDDHYLLAILLPFSPIWRSTCTTRQSPQAIRQSQMATSWGYNTVQDRQAWLLDSQFRLHDWLKMPSFNHAFKICPTVYMQARTQLALFQALKEKKKESSVHINFSHKLHVADIIGCQNCTMDYKRYQWSGHCFAM